MIGSGGEATRERRHPAGEFLCLRLAGKMPALPARIFRRPMKCAAQPCAGFLEFSH
jgi:hypothetical protein